MIIFVFVLVSSCALCWLMQWRPRWLPADRLHTTEYLQKRQTQWLYLLACCIILFFAVCRADTVGGDLGNYQRHFEAVRTMGTYDGHEPAYILLQKVVVALQGNFQLFIMVCALLTLVPMLFALIRTNRSYLWLGMLVFIAEAYASSFSLLRGSLAYACLYLAFYFKDSQHKFHKPIFYGLLVLAVSFHYSSIILVLAFLLLDRKLNNVWYMLAAIATLLATQLEDLFSYIVINLLPAYQSYVVLGRERFFSYVPALNFFLFGVLTVLCFLYRDELLRRNPKNRLLMNMAVAALCITVGFYWFSMTIRIAQMFRYFCVFLVPEIVACEKNPLFRRLLLIGFTLFYLLLFVFFVTGKNGVIPYQFFWQG